MWDGQIGYGRHAIIHPGRITSRDASILRHLEPC